MIQKYRKRPVAIEAIQFDGSCDNLEEIKKFVGKDLLYYYSKIDDKGDIYYVGLEIYTLEGNMKANLGDYIIKGVNGEFYPCKPDIFEKTYEKEN